MRLNDVYLNDRPLTFYANISSTQCLIIDSVTLPLLMQGPLSYLPVQRPPISKIININIKQLTLTSPHDWDPYRTDNI